MAQLGEHYDGTKLLSLVDMDGDKPGFYICETNRNGGKTTYFGRYLINRFLKRNEMFILMYRLQDELKDVPEKFFNGDLKDLFFNDYEMTSTCEKGAGYSTLYLNGVKCGFAVALYASNKIRKSSQYFRDVETIFFDEFQLEDMSYKPKELVHFQSILKSVGRGKGKAVRPIRVIMACNPVSILNPYYSSMGITTRIMQNGDFIRGSGWVLETSVVEKVKEAAKNDVIAKAFANSDYMKFANEGIHLIDESAFIETPKGKNKYIMTLRYNGKDYGVREYYEHGCVFVSSSFDATCKTKIACTKEDHTYNYVLDTSDKNWITIFRDLFSKGVFRFGDVESKNALLTFIAYR